MENIILARTLPEKEALEAIKKYLNLFCCECCDGSFAKYATLESYMEKQIKNLWFDVDYDDPWVNANDIREALKEDNYMKLSTVLCEAIKQIHRAEDALLALNIRKAMFDSEVSQYNKPLKKCHKTGV